MSTIPKGIPSALVGGAMLSSDKTRDYAWAAPLAIAAPAAGRAFKSMGLKGLAAQMIAPALSGSVLAGINHMQYKGEEIDPDEYTRGE